MVPARRLQGRVALVFGAGSSGPGWGNGKAAAVQYAREGAAVVAVDQFTAAAQETADIIRLEGNAAIAQQADVTSAESIGRAVEATLAQYGRIDILHNNVGITDMGALEDITEARWKKVMDVNLSSVYRSCRRVIPVMRRQGRGAIVNISSIAAVLINPYPYYSYYASKAALNQFTKALAVQYARHGIRANTIMPGLMKTPMVEKQIVGQHGDAAEMQRARDAMSPMGRQGDAWDVARAAAFLASDDAAYITGVCLPVDGGLSCLAG
ncbi:MAG: 3-oxoacyl-ACP reductase [Rhodospirillales bacterium 70-18]|nr:MAG: 3-oxoacyl-ACP reductase [Rhodospirillales bacterium 70-18]